MRLFLIVCCLFALCAGLWAADSLAKVYVNGKLQKYEPAARVQGGNTYVPLRQGAASLGFTCEWMPQQNAAKVCDDKGCILIKKSEGIIVKGSLFLPLRKMAEAFGAKVTWDAKKKAVMIEKTPVKLKAH